MSKYRQAAKVDNNQNEIVKALRKLGFTVLTGHDDLLVYTINNLYQFEVKKKSPFGKKGKLLQDDIKDSQYKLLWICNFNYVILWSVQQAIDYAQGNKIDEVITPYQFQQNYKKWLTPKKLNYLRKEKIIVDGIMPDEICGDCWLNGKDKFNCECEL